jgi:hypothetical protein
LWTYEDRATFPEFLDAVELGLRVDSGPHQVPA